jgi:hypothetical protein
MVFLFYAEIRKSTYQRKPESNTGFAIAKSQEIFVISRKGISVMPNG